MNGFRSVILWFLLLPALGLLAFGPRPNATLPRDRVVVQYWEKWTGTEEAQMKQIVDDFNGSVGLEKRIFVRYLSMSNVNQKTLVATAAGVPPDIAGIWDAQLVQFAALDALEPLEDLAGAHGIGAGLYKPVYWDACNYQGHLWGLISTPAVVALHYNKQIFHESAAALRAAGLDPDRAPASIAELDRYADALNQFDSAGRIERAGYLPSEPGWYMAFTSYWFGGRLFDESTNRFTFTEPQNVRAWEWVRNYSKKLGRESISEFRSGVGGFNSTQNAFLVGKVAMEQQGPWMANYIYNLNRSMSEVLVPREKEFDLPRRTDNYAWAVAPFPSAVPGVTDVSFCDFDVLAIPRGARHKREAFEFIAYVNRQDVMEKLCSLHCKNSPLNQVSDAFISRHPNPYVGVFEKLARSPSARTVPKVPIWPEVSDELGVMAQRILRLEQEPADALRTAQDRMQQKLDNYLSKQKARRAAGRDQRMKRRELQNFAKGMAFLSPWLIGFACFTVIPIILSGYYSLCDYSLLQRPLYQGAANYRELAADPVFWTALINTFRYAAMALPAGLLVSLGLALMLNAKIRGQTLYRTIIFLPSLVPTVASAMLWLTLFNARLGLFNTLLAKVGIHGPGWLSDKQWAMPSLAFMSLWGVGHTVVIYLAGLQDVPRELHEAAEIDGAGAWRRLVNVTLPMLTPVIFFNLIMAIIGTFQVFNVPFIMTGGGPDRATYFFTMYSYDNAFTYLKMGYASAMAWVQLLIILSLTLLAFWSGRRWVHYGS